MYGKPDIDLFASRLNCQISCYFSWKPDNHAQAVDAFKQSRTICTNYMYIFPPFSVNGLVFQKIEKELSGDSSASVADTSLISKIIENGNKLS